MAYQIAVAALVEKLGGAEKVSAGLFDCGLSPVAPVGVLRWVDRRSIRSNRLADLLKLAEFQDIKIDIYDFIKPVRAGAVDND